MHCSAGVGRTGTFIALYQLMAELEQSFSLNDKSVGKMSEKQREEHYSSKTIDVFNTTLELRSKRVFMVSEIGLRLRDNTFIWQKCDKLING